MIHHLKLAFRNLLKQKTGSLINIFGLSLSIAVCLLLVLFVQRELTFDHFNQNYHQIYRLLDVDKDGRSPNHPIILNKLLEEKIPELQKGTMLLYYNNTPTFFKYDQDNYILQNVAFTTQSFFDIFTVEFVNGTADDALNAPNKAVITESVAKKMFGNKNPIGEIINYNNSYDYEITGVIKDLPETSHFKVSILASLESYNDINSYMMNSWNNSSTSFYYTIPENTDIFILEHKIGDAFNQARPENIAKSTFKLQPLSKVHLYSSDTIWDNAFKGDIQLVIAFILIVFFIVCIASFNYINLAMALSGKRNFYTGIQKILGADGKTIFASSFTESFLLVFICAICAIFITIIFIPGFNQIMGTSIILSFSNSVIILTLIGLIILTLVLSSFYQVWQYKRIKPIAVLSSKGENIRFGKKRSFPRFSQLFSIIQLVISIILVIGVITIQKQTSLLLDKKLGFNKSDLVMIKNPWDENIHKRFNLLAERFLEMPEVIGVSASWNVPGQYINNYGRVEVIGDGEQKYANFGQLPVDVNFLDVLETEFLFGRNFDPSISSDSNKVVINKRGMELLGLKKPIGQMIKNSFIEDDNIYEIIGVVDDIQYRSLKELSKPVVFYMSDSGLGKIVLRLNNGDALQNINKIEKIWNSIETEYPFEFEFIDQMIQTNYKKEIRTRNVLSVMAFLAIVISMLGIFGLVIFITQSRIKEIGIRKVNGAKISEILVMLNKDFMKWVTIAFVIAVPISYLVMQKWLENFAYKTELSWWIFALAGIFTLSTTLLTVSLQSWRAASRNPIDALRDE